MATFSRELRRGLPRVAGGEPWPPAGEAPEHVVTAGSAAAPAAAPAAAAPAPEPAPAAAPAPPVEVAPEPPVTETQAAETSAAEAPAAAASEPAAAAAPTPAAAAAATGGETVTVALRRGLPRVKGGEPWPPAGEAQVRAGGTPAAMAPAATPAAEAAEPTPEPAAPAAAAAPAAPASGAESDAESATAAQPAASAAGAPAPAGSSEVVLGDVPLRRGLPRVKGGEPWPPAGPAPVRQAAAAAPAAPEAAAPAAPEAAATSASAGQAAIAPEAPTAEPVEPTPTVAQQAPEQPAIAPEAPTAEPAREAQQTAPAKPAPAPAPQAAPAAKPAKPAAPAKPAREPVVIGSRTLAQWAKLVALWGGGLIVAAGIIVLAARGVTTLPGVPEFLERYPGEYHSPADPEPGFPAWARWTHFLNIFLMVLVIRTGLQVRMQQKPPAFWTPRKGGKKISINLWLHTSLDVLWLANGIVFVVLLFVSGHWARIVPTSWEVFPNAVSAGLQYLTLQWPVEDGWVNYNSLQQLMYFTVVFIAAPVSAITGLRMSEWWPEKATKLNKLYPAPVARALHFPTMLFFVLFIIVHVFLVFATGALKNLNHMFNGTPEVSWVGFWWFVAGLAVTVGAVVAARPLVVAPIASLFGKVSNR